VAEKSSKIEINKVYQLQRFKVLPSKSLYRAVDAPVMIQLTIYTQAHIVKNPPSTFPSFIYRLTNFEQIPSIVGRNESFVGNNYTLPHICMYASACVVFVLFPHRRFSLSFSFFNQTVD
jgi:hypothetical protein